MKKWYMKMTKQKVQKMNAKVLKTEEEEPLEEQICKKQKKVGTEARKPDRKD